LAFAHASIPVAVTTAVGHVDEVTVRVVGPALVVVMGSRAKPPLVRRMLSGVVPAASK
jgi:hypothetical protein